MTLWFWRFFFIFLLQFFFQIQCDMDILYNFTNNMHGWFHFLGGIVFWAKKWDQIFVKIMFLEFTQKFDLIRMIKLPNKSIYSYIKVKLCNGHDVIDQVTSTIDLDRKNVYNSLNIGPRTPKSMYILIYQGQAFQWSWCHRSGDVHHWPR